MASSSKSSGSSSPFASSPQWVHDVFLSFRGKDTRNNFTAHLHNALVQRGIKAYMDDSELERGKAIEPTLWKAIEESMFSIIIFSRDYASSPWCLDELVKIVDCMKENRGHIALPVFYDVDPSEVAEQSGNYEKAFLKHEECFKENMQRVKSWRDGLTHVANVSGWDVRNRNESEIIKEIVDKIRYKLSPNFPSISEDLVGLDSRLKVIHGILSEELSDVRIIGICGMGGIGKTTIAKVVYDRIHWQFERSCFLENIRERFEKNGLLPLQEQLVSEILVDWSKRQAHSRRINEMQNRLRHQSVLIILDDVDQLELLEKLAVKHDWFGPGSRIIITSRDRHLLDAFGVDGIYEPEELNQDEALMLLSRKAFKHDQPKEGYWEISQSVMAYAKGLPLALEVLGSFLCGRKMIEWQSTINRLNKNPNKKISDVLRISFDGLEVLEQKIFLDIACFFKGMDKDHITRILNDCGFDADIGVEVLIQKSLLRVIKNALEMHDLLQAMGREIVYQESPNEPGRRSRLWAHNDIFRVLNKNTVREEIEGIFLELPETQEAQGNAEAFSKMPRLRVLMIRNVHFSQGPACLSDDLVFLNWCAYPSKSLPSGFKPDKLVELDMQYSCIEQLCKEIKALNNLKIINLSHSQNLRKTPDVTNIPHLERLILEDCANLTEVHLSIGLHKKLVHVKLADCKNLRNFLSSLEMESLEILNLRGCSKVKKLPNIAGDMKRLQELLLDGSSIQELPLSFHQLTGLVILTLNDCKNLESIPSWINSLKSLKTLEISGCSKLRNLPESLGEVYSLEKLDASGTFIRQPPVSIFHLKKLKELSFSGVKGERSNSKPNFLQNLMFPFQLMVRKNVNPGILILPPLSGLSSLAKLDLSYCNLGEGTAPRDLACLPSLSHLNLSGNNIVSLPANINQLSSLKCLWLVDCKMLQSLPQLPSNTYSVIVDGCTSLEKLTDPIQLCNLSGSWFSGFNCFKLFEDCNGDGEVTLLKRYFQGSWSNTKSRFSVVVPGNIIPKWFSHQSNGSSVSIKTPRSLHDTSDWMGIAICATFRIPSFPDHLVGEQAFIGCRFKIGSGYSASYGFIFNKTFEQTQSDHLWLSYLSFEFFMACGIESFDEVLFVMENGINFIKCGAREVYLQDVEEMCDNSTFGESDTSATHGVIIKEIHNGASADAEPEGCVSSDEEPPHKRHKQFKSF